MADRTDSLREVDVVVVTYNPGETIEDFLSSLDRMGSAGSVTVVDSASSEDTAKQAAARHGARFLRMQTNRGYGTAVNAGASQGRAAWIAIANSDVLLSPDSLGILVDAGDQSEDIGAVGPLIRDFDGSLYPSARPLPTLGVGIGHAVFGKVWPRNPWTAAYKKGLDPSRGPVDVGWLSGSFVVVRRRAFEEIGGFDEGFFMFMEDVDLGRRLGIAGYRRRWVPGAVVSHVGGHSWKSDPEPMIRAHHASVARYLSLAYPGWWRAPLRGILRVGLKAREALAVAAARRAEAD